MIESNLLVGNPTSTPFSQHTARSYMLKAITVWVSQKLLTQIS